MQTDTSRDKLFMLRALELASRGRYTTSPNPRVGAVVVSRGPNRPVIVGEGYHRRPGEPHAEILALEQAVQRSRGSTLYVNLEPCSHHGRTPPCVEAILSAGVSRVVVAMEDPFPEVSGKGLERLRASGVEVDVGICEGQARALNRFFCSVHRRGRPWVILKMAMSLDGKIATRTGDSRWISCDRSREVVHDLRAEVDAVLIGSGTALRDRPSLTARPITPQPGEFPQPRRVVLDTRGRLLSRPDVIRDTDAGPVEVFVGPYAKRHAVNPAAFPFRVVKVGALGEHVCLEEVLACLAREGVLSVMVEGGREVATSFLQSGLVDEVVFFIAPIFIGGSDSPSICESGGVDRIADALRLKDVEVERLESDIMIRGRLSDMP